jgi:WS/DGAT/MGAT family acyltransferase
MAAGDRLGALDMSFLNIEDDTAHLHVASVMIFDGEPPSHEEFVESVSRRLHLVPRYRQKVAFMPLNAGRPRWVDDPHFNIGYHVSRSALPPPGSEQQLRDLAGRLFSQQLDRDRPLWELWIVEGLEGGRFAAVSKTHHALIDGIAGVDLMSVLFDTKPSPTVPPDPGRPWNPRPTPSAAELVAEALIERATVPGEAVGAVKDALRRPRTVAGGVVEKLVGVGAFAWAGLRPAPASPYNQRIGPHRRFTWIRTSLADVKAIKDELGGTVNDVVLATVAGGLGRHMRRRGDDTSGLNLRAFVPVSVRAADDGGSGGNQVSGMIAPLPVGEEDPRRRLATVSAAMAQLKSSGQAVGAKALTDLSGFAPPNILSQASRLSSRQRFVNLVVTNVPGPQDPLYLGGREMRDIFPMVPLANNTALGVAIMSYHGRMNFGLHADWDVLPDLEDLAEDFERSLAELARAAGQRLHPPRAMASTGASNGKKRSATGRRATGRRKAAAAGSRGNGGKGS